MRDAEALKVPLSSNQPTICATVHLTSPQTNDDANTPTLSFFTSRMSFLPPINSVKATKAHFWGLIVRQNFCGWTPQGPSEKSLQRIITKYYCGIDAAGHGYERGISSLIGQRMFSFLLVSPIYAYRTSLSKTVNNELVIILYCVFYHSHVWTSHVYFIFHYSAPAASMVNDGWLVGA